MKSMLSPKSREVKLSAEADRLPGIMLAAKRQRLDHQLAPQPTPAMPGSDRNTANPNRQCDLDPRQQPQTAGEIAPVAQQQMRCPLIEAVEVGIGRALLDDKNPLAETQQLVQRRRR